MSDAAVTGIIEMTQSDPDFDAIFSNLFGIGELFMVSKLKLRQYPAILTN